jgi:hypothetical protein
MEDMAMQFTKHELEVFPVLNGKTEYEVSLMLEQLDLDKLLLFHARIDPIFFHQFVLAQTPVNLYSQKIRNIIITPLRKLVISFKRKKIYEMQRGELANQAK